MARDSFVFYRSFFEAIKRMPIEVQTEVYRLYRYCPWMRGMATSQISCNNGIDKKASHVPL